MRTDTAGAVHEFVGGLVERNRRFSVGARVSDDLDHAIASVPEDAGRPAVDASGETRRGAFVAELPLDLGAWPQGTRAICRKERPHPGAQLRLWVGVLNREVLLEAGKRGSLGEDPLWRGICHPG